MAGEDGLVWELETGGRATQEDLEPAYEALDGNSARALALRAVEAVERDHVGGGYEVIFVLARVTCFFPEALAGLHGRLLDAQILSSFMAGMPLQAGVMFRSADAQSRDRLSALVATTKDARLGRYAIESLSWVDHAAVPRALLGIYEDPPRWFAEDQATVQWYALRAGWELLGSGEALHLRLSKRCNRITRGADPNSPVQVISRVEQSCGGCSGPLTVLLDIDLSDERLQMLGLSGQRLRVLTCERCVCYGTVYAEVDLTGRARWLKESHQHRDHPEWHYFPEPGLGLAGQRRTPFEAHALGIHMSQLGGQASWIQNPDYPACPGCRQLMPFLGQVDISDVAAEGMIYAFFDPACNIVATVYQQT